MSLNQAYVERSISHEMRTSYLTTQIKMDLGGFIRKRQYLRNWVIGKSLKSMGYPPVLIGDLVEYIRKSAENAFERGVFVVTSRVLAMEEFPFVDARDLIDHLREKEGEYFDPMLWYTLDAFKNTLRSENYSEQIVYEIAPIVLRHARIAFLRGIKGAASKLVVRH